jgi:hypothetical protein
MYLELRAGGGVNGIGGRESFEGSGVDRGADDLFWIGQNRDGVRLEAGAGSLTGFELASKMTAGRGTWR